MKAIKIISILDLSLLFSCEEKTDDIIVPQTQNAPNINFIESSKSMYSPTGVTIPIIADISDDQSLTNITLLVTNTYNTDSVFIEWKSLMTDSVRIDTSFVASTASGSNTNFTIKIKAIDNQKLTTESTKYTPVMD